MDFIVYLPVIEIEYVQMATEMHDLDKATLKELRKEMRQAAKASSGYIYVYSYPAYWARKKNELRVVDGSIRNRPSKNSATIWGIRVEGESQPLPRTFRKKERAVAYAKSLKKVGRGRKVLVR